VEYSDTPGFRGKFKDPSGKILGSDADPAIASEVSVRFAAKIRAIGTDDKEVRATFWFARFAESDGASWKPLSPQVGKTFGPVPKLPHTWK
jgi:hypothetical protein